MFVDSSLMRTQAMLQKGMGVALQRREVIADNIANVDVPGFKRSEVLFESVLKRTLQEEERAKSERLPARMNNSRHIPFEREPDWRDVDAKFNTDYQTIMRTDGNNVDMEREMTLAAENQLRYSAMTQALNNNFKKLNIVLRAN